MAVRIICRNCKKPILDKYIMVFEEDENEGIITTFALCFSCAKKEGVCLRHKCFPETFVDGGTFCMECACEVLEKYKGEKQILVFYSLKYNLPAEEWHRISKIISENIEKAIPLLFLIITAKAMAEGMSVMRLVKQIKKAQSADLIVPKEERE